MAESRSGITSLRVVNGKKIKCKGISTMEMVIQRMPMNDKVYFSSKGDFETTSIFPGQWITRSLRRKTFKLLALDSTYFNRFVWVCPNWDVKSNNQKFKNAFAYFGTTNEKHGNKPAANCFCMSRSKSRIRTCYLESRETETIPDKMCNVKKQIYFEKIQEDLALKLLKQGRLFRKQENVVLDVDEEYIGYEFPFAPLLATGLTIADIMSIIMRNERKADNVLSKIIFEISKQRQHFCMKKKPENCSKFPMSHNFVSAIHMFTKPLSSLSPALSCKKKVATKYLEKFALKLASMKEKQLLAIREVGFCFISLLKTLYWENSFQLCLGGSVLNNSIHHLHSLQQQEVFSRIKFFQKFMSEVKFRPRFITLTRSLRNGFTLRNYFHKIEQEILSSFQAFHSRLLVNYDSDLLGGKIGWPKRHSQNASPTLSHKN
ncbi:uncharacterized protein LOC128248350 [Octopus bimaculoides]|uniref:uncharacterized protein LOC128248350 n=1 Tax=Octopus bimaculoides TaxID=37653 RepID=UPI0022E70809|nr:uncharacterized protein LOC128248350 [Octopus bimaculoides]